MSHEFLSSHTARFAECVRDCFRDMLGTEIVLDGSVCDDHPFAPRRPVVVMIHFTGRIQGDYVINLEEETASGLIGAWSEGMAPSELKELRKEFGGLLKEVLNTAVGMAIPLVEEKYGRLTYHPPMVFYGELDPPDVPSGTMTLRSGAGSIDCCLVLDMAGDDLEQKLVRVMEDLDKAKEEMAICYRVLAELIAPSHREKLDPILVGQAETVLREVHDMLESSGSTVD
ncbi:MAG: hypothetical protein IPN71_12925 [Fibrobacteres bacterium]|jgi:CheY-specific phosphatase CheX|nr:hypothetical protein [Fibrobacterota bacterium]